MFALAVLKLPDPRRCFPKCRKFRCGKSALQFRGKTVWCRWTEEPCNPANCSFAICASRRLLPNGVCGETVRRRTAEKDPEEDIIETIKVRGKTYRKIGEKEIF